MTAALAVLLGGEVVGEIVRTRSALRLTYTQEARRPGATPLSLSLPTDEGSVSGDRVTTFLWALLPDNDRALDQVARRHGADPRDPMSLLAAIGRDCAGAVQLCRPDEVEEVLSRTGDLVPLSDGDVEQRLAELTMDEGASWVLPSEHWSLGGSQNKFALRRRDGRWFEAHGAQPTSHILKPGVYRLESQALVEHATMRAADACGIETASTEYASFKTENAVVVERFDRTASADGSLVRLHQEDLCQALGVREKYEESGGPGAGQIIRLLRDAARTPSEAAGSTARFVEGLVFNTVMACSDAHARNYAVLLDGDSVRLAPLYDTATSLAYDVRPGVGRVLSMSIDGVFEAGDVTPDRWRRFAEAQRLDETWVLDVVRRVAELAPAGMRRAFDEVEDDWDGRAAALRSRLLPAVEERARRVLAELSPPAGPRSGQGRDRRTG